MAQVKLGNYGDIVGGMPLGYGETDWYKKIGQPFYQDQAATSTNANTTTTPKTTDASTAVPQAEPPAYTSANTASSSDQSSTQLPDYLQAITPVDNSGAGGQETAANKTAADNVGTPTGAVAGTQYDAQGLPISVPLAPLPAAPTPVSNLQTTPASVAADPTLNQTPYGAVVPYQSSYDPTTEAAQNAAAMSAAEQGAMPALNDALAGARENAARASGAGQASGMYSEMSRAPLSKFAQTMGQESATLQAASLGRKTADEQAQAKWQMDQEVQQADWTRNQTAAAFGDEYANQLSDAEWTRQNDADTAKENITIAFQNQQISSDEAWKQWTAVNNNYQTALSNQRADLTQQLAYAQQNQLADKQAALQLEIANIDAEAKRAQASASEDAGLFGGIGGLLGGVAGAIGTVMAA